MFISFFCSIFKRPFVEVPKFLLVNQIPEFKAQFTPYRIPFAPQRKSYRIGLLFSHKKTVVAELIL